MIRTTAAAATLLAIASATQAQVVITEVWPGGISGSEATSDWFELTNLGDTAVDPSGWFYDDESADPTENAPILGLAMIQPGESVIVLASWQDGAASPEQAIQDFVAVWGAANLQGVQIGTSEGAGLSGGGDQVYVFDSNLPEANIIATQAYIAADPPSWFWNPETMSWNDELSMVGIYGAFQSVMPASDSGVFAVGSPGVINGQAMPEPMPLTITEVWAGGLDGSETIPDWFEITNFGDMPFEGADTLFYDDDSADATVADSLSGITTIAPGETVIYLVAWEGDFATASDAIDAFTAVWGADNLAGVQIGFVNDGAGLGGGGDAVYLFDSAMPGANIVAFESYPVAGFPQSYVWNPDTMSWNDEVAAVGVFGAYESLLPAATNPDELAIGSPGILDTPAAGPDLDNSGFVDSADLNLVLGSFGCTVESAPCAGDTDADADTDSQDLNAVLAAFGQTAG